MEVGDKVVCIEVTLGLILYKTYTIEEISVKFMYSIKLKENTYLFWYHSTQFISLIEFRKNKIEKIKKRICLV